MNELRKNILDYYEKCSNQIDNHAEFLLSNPGITERDTNQINTLREIFITQLKVNEKYNINTLELNRNKYHNLVYVDYLINLAFKNKFCFFIPIDPCRSSLFKTNRFGVIIVLNQYINEEIIEYLIELTNGRLGRRDLSLTLDDFEVFLKIHVIYELISSKSNESVIDLTIIEDNKLLRLDINSAHHDLDNLDWLESIINLEKLDLLTLSFEYLDSLDFSLFSKFKNLKSLRFDYGSLEMLQDFNFSGLESLENLTLEININRTEPKMFYGLDKLNKLEFIRTGLKNFKDFQLKECVNLTRLIIFSHEIKQIEENTFENLRNLKCLKLTGNRIENLSPNCFNGLRSLEELYLDSQKTQLVINESAFYGLHNLQCLYLKKNSITEMSKNTFNGLDNLKFLTLRENSLRSFDYNLINCLTSLEFLDISKNDDLIIDYEKLSLNKLKYLVIDSKVLPSFSSISLQGLEVYDLENIRLGSFTNQLELEYLNLTFTKCDDILDMLTHEIFNGLSKLKFLRIKFREPVFNSFQKLEHFKEMFMSFIDKNSERMPAIYFENRDKRYNKVIETDCIIVQASNLSRELEFFEKHLNVSNECRKAVMNVIHQMHFNQ